MTRVPLVVHVINRLDIGGLENGLVNLINHMPAHRYRHAIVCLTEASRFRERLRHNEVPIVALGKRSGQTWKMHAEFWRLVRLWRPAIVHTRNLSTLECSVSAALGNVPIRIHGEHGRDVYDLDGANRKYNLLRRTLKPFVHRYVAVSTELADWLVQVVRVRPESVTRITNGVDLERFRPRTGRRLALGPSGFASADALVVGTVGRMEAVKDQLTLVRAFVEVLAADRAAREHLRLVLVGDGRLRDEARRLLRDANAESLAWMPGELDDIPAVMQGLDLFVLPSLREGVSNTILEAMASGLPVVATRVGGSAELVAEGETGMLVPPADSGALANAIRAYLGNRDWLGVQGRAARTRAEAKFGLDQMVRAYLDLYDSLSAGPRKRTPVGTKERPLPCVA